MNVPQSIGFIYGVILKQIGAATEVKRKVKLFLCTSWKAYRGSRGTDPFNPNYGSSLKGCSFTPVERALGTNLTGKRVDPPFSPVYKFRVRCLVTILTELPVG